MKYIFGVDVTNDKRNRIKDGHVFHSRFASTQLREAYTRCDLIRECNEEKTTFPIWLQIIHLILVVASGIFISSIAENLKKFTYAEMYARNPVACYIEVIVMFLAVVLSLAGMYKKKKYENSDEYKHNMEYMDSVSEYARREFRVPEYARLIDLLMFNYKIKKEKLKIIERTDLFTRGYINAENCPCYCYVKGDNLHITNLHDEWTIPCGCITEIKMMKQEIYVPRWNKKIKYNEGIYKKYKLETNGAGQIVFDICYAIAITWHEEKYELFIPPYEVDEMKSVLGIW